MIGTIMDLCELCKRLFSILAAMRRELEKLGCNREILRNWDREINHLRDMFYKLSK